jgi:hypothetical protein
MADATIRWINYGYKKAPQSPVGLSITTLVLLFVGGQ